jgi:predicted acetyltransferase
MAEFRPVADADEAAFDRLTGYAFDAGSGPFDPDEDTPERLERYFGFGERRGMYEDGRPRAVSAHIPFQTTVRGAPFTMGGVTLVASDPAERRRGLVGEMLAASLAEYRDRGWNLAGLYPFDEAFYARYGWATACRRREETVDVDALAPVAEAAGQVGEFRRVQPEDWELLEPVYEEWLADRPLAISRTAEWWRNRRFHTYRSALFGYAWERDGEVRGYLLYDVDGDDGLLRVHELAHRDHEALTHLLRFCRDHDAQVDRVEVVGPDEPRLGDVVGDRSALDVAVNGGVMLRVVDVAAVLSSLSYPGDASAEVVLAVDDEHAPWNDATFRLRVADGAATVERSDAAPDATLDVGTLSQLVAGFRDAARARELGDLTADEGTAATLGSLFPERDPFVSEWF